MQTSQWDSFFHIRSSLHVFGGEVKYDGAFHVIAVPDVADGTEEAVQDGQTEVVQVDDAGTAEIVLRMTHLIFQREYETRGVQRKVHDAAMFSCVCVFFFLKTIENR